MRVAARKIPRLFVRFRKVSAVLEIRITAPSRDTCHIIGHFYAVFLEGGYKASGTRDGA